MFAPLVMSAVVSLVTAPFADQTASAPYPSLTRSPIVRTVPASRVVPMQATASTHARTATTPATGVGVQVLLIETGAPVLNSVGQALSDLGVSFDYVQTADFTTLTLRGYASVLVAMDGGAILDASVAVLQDYVVQGGNLVMLGGTCYQPFALAVEARLLDVDTTNYCWSLVAAPPDLTVESPYHRLAHGLPATYDFMNHSATYYSVRCEDPEASVAAVNGDNYQALLFKPIGMGHLSWFINSPTEYYWVNAPDYQILKQVIANVLQRAQVAVLQTQLSVWDSVGRALDELGVPFDLYAIDSFFDIYLEAYSTVIVAMDGGSLDDAGIASLQAYAGNGGNLVMMGGSNYQPFVDAVNARLLTIDTVTHYWTMVSGTPHLVVTKADHRLARSLPAGYNFVDLGASNYMIRSLDPDTQVAAHNGDGYDAILSKPIGTGRLSWFINSPYDWYWSNAADFQILKQFLDNARCAVGTATWFNYGTGWPGTFGVPALTADHAPVVGTRLTVDIGNSRAANTVGFLFLGLTNADLPTSYGGHLLLLPYSVFTVPVASGGAALPATLPDIWTIIGLPVFLQVIEMDPGASHGVSFSRGLELVFGDA